MEISDRNLRESRRSSRFIISFRRIEKFYFPIPHGKMLICLRLYHRLQGGQPSEVYRPNVQACPDDRFINVSLISSDNLLFASNRIELETSSTSPPTSTSFFYLQKSSFERDILSGNRIIFTSIILCIIARSYFEFVSSRKQIDFKIFLSRVVKEIITLFSLLNSCIQSDEFMTQSYLEIILVPRKM